MNAAIVGTVLPSLQQLGGMRVHRTLPTRGVAMVGPFIFADVFGPAPFPSGPGMGVAPHPHIGISTVTWLFSGAIHHRDSLGTSAMIRPGQVNLMTAGRGITHSERPPAAGAGDIPTLWGMQTWLALPTLWKRWLPPSNSRPPCRLSMRTARAQRSSWVRSGARPRLPLATRRPSMPRLCSRPAVRSQSNPLPPNER